MNKLLLLASALFTLTACEPANGSDAFTAAEFGAVDGFSAENFGVERTAALEFDEDDGACTQTEEYWASHSIYDERTDAWPVSEDTSACGFTIYEWMQRDEDEAYTVLARAWIAAHLNMATGARVPAEVASAYGRAGDILETCAADDELAAYQLASILTEYNDGERGVDACEPSFALAS